MKKKNLLTLCSGEATTLELKNYKITSDDVLEFSKLYEEVMKLEKKSVDFPERDNIKEQLGEKLEILKTGMSLINNDISLKYKNYNSKNKSSRRKTIIFKESLG